MYPRKWLTVAPSTRLPLANDFDSWAAAPSPVVMVGALLPEKYPEPEPNISRTRCRRLACRSESRHRSARSTSRQAACGDCLGQKGYGLPWCTLEGTSGFVRAGWAADESAGIAALSAEGTSGFLRAGWATDESAGIAALSAEAR